MSTASEDPISDDECVWRRIKVPEQIVGEPGGEYRPSSAAFDDSSDGTPLSVDRASVAGDPAHTLRGHAGFALAELRVGYIRSLDLDVIPDPLPENDAHAGIVGKKTRGVKRQLASGSSWRVPPEV